MGRSSSERASRFYVLNLSRHDGFATAATGALTGVMLAATVVALMGSKNTKSLGVSCEAIVLLKIV